MDYTDIYQFSKEGVIEGGGGGGGGGIPLFLYGMENENENVQYGGGSLLSSLYFPGGLFVNSYNDDNNDDNINNETIHPFSINVFEDYDVFLELVSISPQKQKQKQNKNKTKKIIFKKNKNKYSKKIS